MTSRFCKRTPTPHCIQSNLSKRCICKFSSCHNLFLPQLPGQSICDISGLIFTVRNVVAARLSFHRRLSFCSQGGGVFSQHALGQTPPWADTPLPSACWDTHHPHPAQCMLGYTPPTQCMLGYTPPTNACWDKGHPPPPPVQRTVRILLECILVCKDFSCN